MKMNGTANKLVRIEIIGWVLTIFFGMLSFLSSIQVVLFAVTMDWDQFLKMKSNLPDSFPPVVQIMFGYLPILMIIQFGASLTGLVASLGFLKRKNWARLLLVAVLVFGIIYCIAGNVIAWLALKVPSSSVVADSRLNDNIMITAMIVLGIIMCAAISWIIHLLLSEDTKIQFKIEE